MVSGGMFQRSGPIVPMRERMIVQIGDVLADDLRLRDEHVARGEWTVEFMQRNLRLDAQNIAQFLQLSTWPVGQHDIADMQDIVRHRDML
jgi:hypothetical protein